MSACGLAPVVLLDCVFAVVAVWLAGDTEDFLHVGFLHAHHSSCLHIAYITGPTKIKITTPTVKPAIPPAVQPDVSSTGASVVTTAYSQFLYSVSEIYSIQNVDISIRTKCYIFT